MQVCDGGAHDSARWQGSQRTLCCPLGCAGVSSLLCPFTHLCTHWMVTASCIHVSGMHQAHTMQAPGHMWHWPADLLWVQKVQRARLDAITHLVHRAAAANYKAAHG